MDVVRNENWLRDVIVNHVDIIKQNSYKVNDIGKYMYWKLYWLHVILI